MRENLSYSPRAAGDRVLACVLIDDCVCVCACEIRLISVCAGVICTRGLMPGLLVGYQVMLGSP